ncbi:diaminopropionate ammonia-lyase [Algicella marina]|uniref:Diaminopropionate ammonia-lyase n=1 Tax=Algicella marina TaxID=2683284 RepID=A0A6P1T1H7_9RHOB|nr:diaminopropionate ammonia-lyase [Algicella marina]QHQ34382.1 diaminopropionate ammonia-lyase [Algicella marina]
MTLIANAAARRDAEWTAAQDEILSDAGLQAAGSAIRNWPNYQVTPLVELPTLAQRMGVAALHLKDEGARFGLRSFKALGGAYAVACVLRRELERQSGFPVPLAEITGGSMADDVAAITVACATDGNHGRSVAWGAQQFGCRAVIFIHETVSEGRAAEIARFGAEVRRTKGDYDDSVRIASETAAAEGWFVVSDTSWPGYEDVPRDVMQGYELMASEAFAALTQPPTHIFVQTGVGGMAAAVAGLAKRRWGKARPVVVLADPEGAACWAESFAMGMPQSAKGAVRTIQAGLACGEISVLAWEVLKDHSDWVMTVQDGAAERMMRALARPEGGDPAIVAGESAVAGLCACLQATPAERAAIGLDSQSRVLAFVTEGDTDPALYQKIVGVDAATVLRGGVRAP